MTDIGKAIEAAAMEIFDRISESRRSAGNTFWQSEAVTIISSRIMPVFEELTAENMRLNKVVRSQNEQIIQRLKEILGFKAMTDELAELKAMVREYADKNDRGFYSEGEPGPPCKRCGVIILGDEKPCQNTGCIAFKLREASKE